ncbi:hypothetical protein [Amnibacterium sp.]|nr:hypothetical protein [Amnibacterium sp.]MCU1474514.1 hypothetical protein [Amnibacterium sp.]
MLLIETATGNLPEPDNAEGITYMRERLESFESPMENPDLVDGEA